MNSTAESNTKNFFTPLLLSRNSDEICICVHRGIPWHTVPRAPRSGVIAGGEGGGRVRGRSSSGKVEAAFRAVCGMRRRNHLRRRIDNKCWNEHFEACHGITMWNTWYVHSSRPLLRVPAIEFGERTGAFSKVAARR